MLLLPAYPSARSGLTERRRNGFNNFRALSPPIKVVFVQPTEKTVRPQELGKRESLHKIEISPDFGRLGVQRAGRSGGGRVEPAPLPEPPRVDKDRVLQEVLSEQGEVCKEEAGGSPKEGPKELEEVPLDDKSPRPRPERARPAREEDPQERERLVRLFEQLLAEIYPDRQDCRLGRRASDFRIARGLEGKCRLNRHHSHCGYLENLCQDDPLQDLSPEESPEILSNKSLKDLRSILSRLEWKVQYAGDQLVSGLEERDRLTTEHQGLCDLMTACLQAISNKTSEDTDVRFSVGPGGGDSGFGEWAKAMKMVARLPDGVPSHFRKTLWLSLAEKHLASKNIAWHQVERSIFSDRLNPDDQELSVQIVKDLHRTGCSLFCGTSGQHNQAVLKRVLLAYARWNKTVGYCQGLNMLAALILQVMQGCQGATVKVMIYLIEGVLPESYFADNLRGLSVDMAVFRDLLSLKVPELSRHLDALQLEARESGTSYEPPLMDVFTMQWFLTIFCNCLPQPTVLRLWDLLFLEGDSVLIKAALVIWQNLSERMLSVRSADEFYSIMAVLTREMMEFGLMDANNIIKAMDLLSIPELSELRERYVYNISPWPVAAKKGLRIFYPQHHHGEEAREPRMTPISNHPDREKIALDISALKKQYWKLRERQRQAHIILSAACRNESYSGQSSPALNHLLLGKSALKSVKARTRPGETLHWRDASKTVEGRRASGQSESEAPRRRPVERRRVSSSSSSSSSTELCDSSGDSAAEESPSQAPTSSPLYPESKLPPPSSSPPNLSTSPPRASSASPRPYSASISPRPASTSPRTDSTSPRTDSPSSHPASISPRPDSTSPRTDSPSSRPDSTSPRPELISPTPVTATPRPDSTSPIPVLTSLPFSTSPHPVSNSPRPSSSSTQPSSSPLMPPTPPLSSTSPQPPAISSPCRSPSLPATASLPTTISIPTATSLPATVSPLDPLPPSYHLTNSLLSSLPPISPPSLPPASPSLPSLSPTVPSLVDEAARKRDELMRILKENSEMLGRFRHHSGSPPEEQPVLPRFRHHSPEEPEDIKDIRRRYSVDPFPARAAAKPREVGVKLGLYSQPS